MLYSLSFVPLLFLSGCKIENADQNSQYSSFDDEAPALPPVQINGVVPLQRPSSDLDGWVRPRILLGLSSGQTISAMFDSGASKSKLSLDGPNRYLGGTRKIDVGNTGYKYLRFIDGCTLNVRKVIRETVRVVNAGLAALSIDFHLVTENENKASAQHIGTGPNSNFTASVGGVYGYLSNSWLAQKAPRSWLVLGDQGKDTGLMCANNGADFKTHPLLDDLYWMISGSVEIGGANPTKTTWVIDTGGSPSYEIPTVAYDTLVREIEQDGLSKVVAPTESGKKRSKVTNCQDANSRFPVLFITFGDHRLEVMPAYIQGKGRDQLYYLSSPYGDGSCTLNVYIEDSPAISTDALDKFFLLLDRNRKEVSVCHRNQETVRSLSR